MRGIGFSISEKRRKKNKEENAGAFSKFYGFSCAEGSQDRSSRRS